MISVITSIVVDHGCEHVWDQTKEYKLMFGCRFSTKHIALMSESKNWLIQNQDNVSECSEMSTSKLLFQ
jgi:hypothetical protein